MKLASSTMGQGSLAPNSVFSYPIIVHCHLQWDFVWQRPQQFHSRLSAHHRILFVEGPKVHEGDFAPHFTLRQDEKYPNVTIMQTHFSQSDWSKGGDFIDTMRRVLLDEALQTKLKGKFDRPIQWFYDPMAVTSHLNQHGSIATVYDCMDELTQFKFAPPELITRERRLLYNADVVFTGGRKMRDSKIRFNSNMYFYGCGVDVSHFSKARLDSTKVPDDIAHLKGKVLGYFGVIDERLDYELIDKLAAANPDWHVVMIGPVAKVDPSSFPKHPNLHWLGGRDYQTLPAYTKRFDVALMPFAMNEATEFINPTKALEYMATATPIVSTPVPDVVSNFSEVCQISSTHEEFILDCFIQAEGLDKWAVERGLNMANENTWESIIEKMEGHIQDALCKRAEIERRIRIPVSVPLVVSPMPPSDAIANVVAQAINSAQIANQQVTQPK
jgi:glycosyltransferase involved in cell wall biosynthesis